MLVPMAAAAEIAGVGTASGPIRIDGVLDEPDWALVTPITAFERYRPTDGGPPPGTTEARFLQDERYLYVGFHITGADYDLRARISPREDVNSDDQVAVFLDPFGDERTGYVFWLNALGIQQDFRVSEDGWEMSWDTPFKSRGRVSGDGYDVEIAFPWRSLKFPRTKGAPQDWGVILQRKIPSTGAMYSWPKVSRNPPRAFAGQGKLVGVKPPARGSGLELVPGIAAVQSASRGSVADPLVWTGFSEPLEAIRPSLDARYGITPNTGVTATLNPDFSQLEFDVRPIQLNQRFAFSFVERRPFFLDGVDTLQDPGGALYSRSIGEPVYGVKLHGREGGWVLGALNALDRSPQASFAEHGAPGFDAPDGKQAMNSILRVRRILGQGSVGITALEKDILDGGVVASHRYAGADTSWVLPRRWRIDADFEASQTGTDTDRIWGVSSAMQVARPTGEGTGFELGIRDRTPGHRVEMGFQPQAGITEAWTSVDHTFNVDKAVDVLTPGLMGWGYVERDGDGQLEATASAEMQVGGIHYLELGVSGDAWRQTGEIDGRTKTAKEAGPGGWVEYEADVTRWLGLYGSASGGAELSYSKLVLGTVLRSEAGATLRPTPNVRIDLTGQHQDFWEDDHTSADQARVRLNWQITREWGLRGVSQGTIGTEIEPQLVSSVLLTWLHSPGTAVYLGYAETTDLVRGGALARTVFAKSTVLLRL